MGGEVWTHSARQGRVGEAREGRLGNLVGKCDSLFSSSALSIFKHLPLNSHSLSSSPFFSSTPTPFSVLLCINIHNYTDTCSCEFNDLCLIGAYDSLNPSLYSRHVTQEALRLRRSSALFALKKQRLQQHSRSCLTCLL